MAGMFYSLQEAAQRLGKTEDEIRKLAAANKLRLFRDGSNLLFKIDEVNALAAARLDEDPDLELKPKEPGTDIFADMADVEVPEAKEPTEEDLLLNLGDETPVEEPKSAEEPDIGSALDLEAEPAAEPVLEPTGEEPTAEMDAEALDLEEEPSAEPKMKETAKPAAADASSELGLAPEEDQLAAAVPEEDLLSGLMEDETAAPVQEQPKEEALVDDDISLASESGALAAGSDITDMDTALTGQGINVLGGSGETPAGDSSAETAAPAGEGTEASLEEIEEDVNLDSFGSGSGLLDLSLQADDTSLGGILDEIYTSEGGEEGKAAGAAAGPASMEDISAEADHVTADTTELVSAPEAVMPMTAVAATTFMEVPPDRASNMLGFLLFLPLLALLYAAMVTLAALKNAQLSIVEPIRGMIWPIVGVAILITGVVAAIALTSGRERKPAAVKVKKEKKEKAAKKEAAAEPVPAKSEGKPKKSFLSFSIGKKKK